MPALMSQKLHTIGKETGVLLREVSAEDADPGRQLQYASASDARMLYQLTGAVLDARRTMRASTAEGLSVRVTLTQQAPPGVLNGCSWASDIVLALEHMHAADALRHWHGRVTEAKAAIDRNLNRTPGRDGCVHVSLELLDLAHCA